MNSAIFWRAVLERLEAGTPLFVALVVANTRGSPGTLGARLLVDADGNTQGTIGGGIMEANIVRAARDGLRAGKDAPPSLEQLATLYRRVDGFVIVSGEYNHGIPPALKNLLDHFLEEYFWRPSAIVCYSAGMFGGVRAAVALRTTLAELGMPAIPSECPIPRIAAALDEDGKPQNEHVPRTLDRFLDELEWYARALQRQRRGGTPY